MVLGECARERGALADEIPSDARYARHWVRHQHRITAVVRFRAAYATDREIDEFVDRCAIRPIPRWAAFRPSPTPTFDNQNNQDNQDACGGEGMA